MLFVHVSGGLVMWIDVGCPCPPVRNWWPCIRPCFPFDFLANLQTLWNSIIYRPRFERRCLTVGALGSGTIWDHLLTSTLVGDNEGESGPGQFPYLDWQKDGYFVVFFNTSGILTLKRRSTSWKWRGCWGSKMARGSQESDDDISEIPLTLSTASFSTCLSPAAVAQTLQ